jgi:ABC-type molybdenum transport system ATPase subunit/photorepair protein PhrA
MAKGTPYLEMNDVEAWLGPRQVFHALSLSLFQGEHTVVLGPNGSGKSSLLKLLSRELYPVVREGSWLRLFGQETINLWQLRKRASGCSARINPPHTAAMSKRVMWCSQVCSAPLGWGEARNQRPDNAREQQI